MIIFSFNLGFLYAYENFTETNITSTLTKIEHASNVYVTLKHVKKIKEFYIDESIACNYKYLPIVFTIHSENQTGTVKGWLTEHGNLINSQQNHTNCHIFKK